MSDLTPEQRSAHKRTRNSPRVAGLRIRVDLVNAITKMRAGRNKRRATAAEIRSWKALGRR